MTDTARGVDCSHWQRPSRIDYDRLAETHTFAIVRCAYGTKPDREFPEHVRRLRDVGMAVGGYGFYRSTEPTADQYVAWSEQLDRVRMGPGDIVPTCDVEDDPGVASVSLEWSEPVRLLCDALAGRWTGSMVYGNADDLSRMGNPDWLREHALWIANWTSAPEPLMPPGLDWRIWQHAVAPLPGIYSADIDQNIARLPLPTIRDEAGRRMTTAGETRILAAVEDLKGEFRGMRTVLQSTREDAAATREKVDGLAGYVEAVDARTAENRRRADEHAERIAAVEATGQHQAVTPRSRSGGAKAAWISGGALLLATLITSGVVYFL